jgi:hypothetical protein
MSEFPKINYNNKQVEDSQGNDWSNIETISWDSSSQMPKVPKVPETNSDNLKYIIILLDDKSYLEQKEPQETREARPLRLRRLENSSINKI